METIGIQQLQQHASEVVRRVERGESLGVTNRGRLVAVLTPPSSATGASALMAAGRVRPATRPSPGLPAAIQSNLGSSKVLAELREDR